LQYGKRQGELLDGERPYMNKPRDIPNNMLSLLNENIDGYRVYRNNVRGLHHTISAPSGRGTQSVLLHPAQSKLGTLTSIQALNGKDWERCYDRLEKQVCTHETQ
jgi:hypothetical protein